MEENVKLTKLAKCAGCGAKVGAGVLAQLLEGIQVHKDPNLLVGFDKSDDASVYKVSDELALVQTLDFFPPIADDPYTFGQIAATNALSDIYAMGGDPKLALNIMCVPEDMPKDTVHQILRGGYEKVYEAGALITGGHSIFDDEHGWADDSVFNFEGGCYAKCINLSAEGEPEIYNAIKFGALVENVVMDPDTREFDFDDDSLAVNSRVGYPVEYIPNAELSGMSPSVPKTVIFLTADAYGVLPPISKLDRNQAMYYFVSGFTSKVAGTEIGVTEPVPTFSTCFGEPFLPLDPSVYAAMLAEKVEKAGAKVYLVNTGWNGTGQRMKLRYTRAMVTAALTGAIEKADFVTDPTFGVQVPTAIEGVPSELLIPENTWADKEAYRAACRKLASSFVENFKKYTRMSAEVVAAGPKAE